MPQSFFIFTPNPLKLQETLLSDKIDLRVVPSATCKSVIVGFSTFRHSIMVYSSKKNMKKGITVKLDLTNMQINLLN